ncbi:hypothetical protein ABZZ17_07945 [Streptomyces sp. NPDC006512]|uniref:hypothetical protein n=1 Tax=Streptomyces sp. NPDC006512 TaxID=3154307 RepID=UPI0033B66A26
MVRTRSATLATALLSTLLCGAGGPASARDGVPPDGQALHDAALIGIAAAGSAAAQEFRTADARLSRVSLYLSSTAAGGRVRVEVRGTREDSGSAIASRTVDVAALGGAGAGWVEVPLDAAVTPDTPYYLFAQATTPDGKPVVWHGTRQTAAGAPVSWHRDGPAGRWEAVASRLAFHVNPAGAERCGETDPCYVPAADRIARTSGLLSNGTDVEAVTPEFAVGARYVTGGNVLRLPSGRWRYLPAGRAASVVVEADDALALEQIAESRAWLAAGRIPGAAGARRESAERALLSMRALLRSNGSFAAAWSPFWDFSWPRDSSFAAVAFAHCGYDEEAYRILRYNAGTQRADGTWEARTRLDGSGPPDDRPWQLDGNGWVPWATWQWYRTAPEAGRAARLEALYPMLRKAADHAAGSLDADGLPPASPDYWELSTDTVNIGTAAPLLAGLNAAADLARGLGRTQDATRWAVAAQRLSAGIERRFAPLGYPRTADGLHGRDSAVAFMAPPFNQAPAGLPRALDDTYAALLRPNGGVIPGDDPDAPWGDITWTPSTSFFALAWAGTGEREKADAVVDWVLSKRNALGELPETVSPDGRPKAVVPLGWTDAIVLLALRATEGTPLPAPPMARP